MRKSNEAKLNENGHVIWCPCAKCDVLREVLAAISKYFEEYIAELDYELIYGKGVGVPIGIMNMPQREDGSLIFEEKHLSLSDLQFLHACGIDWFGDERSSSENERSL